ncbi:MAG: phosphoribosylaminoimidazolesuccinocarboxamide synthase [Candidatus Cloacimonadia bacterium]
MEEYPIKKGKVRDIYDLGDKLVIVASDRISAFDYVLPCEIPDKGKVLTQLSKFWFKETEPIISNHFISDNVDDFPEYFQVQIDNFNLRSMLVKKAERLPFEFIVRGYITGSAWRDYEATGKVCGINLPARLRESAPLPEPLFTPSTKADIGHDENIDFSSLKKATGEEIANKLKEVSLKIYNYAHNYLLKRDIILADTKFEFGIVDGELILIDELLTPDSSRFWDKATYQIGTTPKSYDKQFVRDYLAKKGVGQGLRGEVSEDMLPLPPLIIDKTRERYLLAFQKITGKKLL